MRPRTVRPARIIGRRSGALAPQLLHAGADRRKIIGGARSGHVSSVGFSVLPRGTLVNYG